MQAKEGIRATNNMLKMRGNENDSFFFLITLTSFDAQSTFHEYQFSLGNKKDEVAPALPKVICKLRLLNDRSYDR